MDSLIKWLLASFLVACILVAGIVGFEKLVRHVTCENYATKVYSYARTFDDVKYVRCMDGWKR